MYEYVEMPEMPFFDPYSYTRISPLWMVISGPKTGEKAEMMLNPYRKENWTRKSAVRFDRTEKLRRMTA